LKDQDDDNCRTDNLKILFDITQEVMLLSLIRDIQDELNILDHVLGDQHDSLLQLLRGGMQPLRKKNIKKRNLQRDRTPVGSCIDEELALGPTIVNRKAVHKMQRDARRVYNDVGTISTLTSHI
jgi:hypothetical protein